MNTKNASENLSLVSFGVFTVLTVLLFFWQIASYTNMLG